MFACSGGKGPCKRHRESGVAKLGCGRAFTFERCWESVSCLRRNDLHLLVSSPGGKLQVGQLPASEGTEHCNLAPKAPCLAQLRRAHGRTWGAEGREALKASPPNSTS